MLPQVSTRRHAGGEQQCLRNAEGAAAELAQVISQQAEQGHAWRR